MQRGDDSRGTGLPCVRECYRVIGTKPSPGLFHFTLSDFKRTLPSLAVKVPDST
jgi:hypothetical protein